MYRAVTSIGIFTLLLLTGCLSNQENKMSQAQLNAIETREVDASINETYKAASGALFDAGYTISMSDRAGGLLTGTKAIDRSAARLWYSPYIEDTKFAVSIQIREIAPNSCTVRVKTSINGAPKVDKKAIDELWVLMQRQVLMKEPLPLSNEKDKKPSEDVKKQQEDTQNKKSQEQPNAPVTKSPTVIKCGNCGREIGNLEKTKVYEGHVVCLQCYAKLKYHSAE
jgi:hypothetical protein